MEVRPIGATAASPAKHPVLGKITPSVIPSFTKASATYVVGPGQTYTDLAQVAPILQPGDVVDVLGDTSYAGGVQFLSSGSREKKIVIRGVALNGHRPVISGGSVGIEAAGDHYVFEGLDITGAENRCFFQHADDVTLRDSVIHDCPGHGVLGADTDSGSFLMEFDEVYRCGKNGLTSRGRAHHQIYVATDESAHKGSTFRLQLSWIHDGAGGNNVKSRAERNEIYSNWIEGAAFHELELVGPDGQDPTLAREDSDVVGNVFVKPNDFYVVRVGGDGTGSTNGRYRFASNTFVVSSNHPVFRLFDGIESIEMSNNAFVRSGGEGVTVLTDSDAKWTTGSFSAGGPGALSGKRVVGGEDNFVPKGSDVPREWRGTITSTDPGLRDIARFDLRPTPTSPLIGKASNGAPVLASFPIERTLPFPLFEPERAILPARSRRGHTTIGALEAE